MHEIAWCDVLVVEPQLLQPDAFEATASDPVLLMSRFSFDLLLLQNAV